MRLVLVRDAAEELGVSEVQIGRLIASGVLEADRVGRSWVIAPEALRRYAALRPSRGRPLAGAAAWAALERAALAGIGEARHLAVAARRRAVRRSGRVAPGELPYLLDDRRLVRGGADAAAHHGAAVAASPPHDLYVRASEMEAVVADHLVDLDADHHNVRLRVVADRVWPFEPGVRFSSLPIAVVDLVDDLDDRSANEALAALAGSQ